MRYAMLLVAGLVASNAHAATVTLTQIRLSWPLDQSGNPFRLSTSESAFLEFNTTPNTLSLNFEVAADASANVAALVADMRDGLADNLTLSVGSFSNGAPESWFFGDFDAVDANRTGLRRLDYATRDRPALADGTDWHNFEIQSFHVTAVGPLSLNPTLALVVIDVLGVVPEPSSALLLTAAGLWPLQRRSRPRCR